MKRFFAYLALALLAIAIAAVVELALRKPEPAVSIERVRLMT